MEDEEMQRDPQQSEDCQRIFERFRAGIRCHRGNRMRKWLCDNWNHFYAGDDTSLAIDTDVHRGTVGRWRNGLQEITPEHIDRLQLAFAACAEQKGLDLDAMELSLKHYEPTARSLAIEGYLAALSGLMKDQVVDSAKFDYFLTLASDKDWRRAYELGEEKELEEIALGVLGKAKGRSSAIGTAQDLKELYAAWRGPWDDLQNCISQSLRNLI